MNKKRQEENLRKKFNRIVSLICAVVLLFGSVQIASPVTAFADQNSETAAQTETQVESVDGSQKNAQDDTNPVSDASAQNEIQTETQSISQVPAKDQTESALSEAGTQFTKDVASLNWDEIQKTREEKFEADSALIHNSEDAEAQSAAASADSNMKQVQDKLTALQKTYQSLSDTDRADESVKSAEETLTSIIDKLSTFEKEYFEKQVEAFTKAENAKDTETDKDQASYQADLNSLKAIYKELSDEQKEDSNVKNAYETLQKFLGEETTVSEQTTEMSSDSDKPEKESAAAAKPAALAKKAPASVSAESITGSLGCKDELTKNVLFDTVNDTDFFQFMVTVEKADGTKNEYTTSLSSEKYHATIDYDYNFKITGIPLEDTDKVTVTCVPNSSISGYGFNSTETTSTVKDGKWDADKLTLSIDEVSITINDFALGDTGNTLYSNGSCTMDDGKGHQYSRNIAFWGNGASHPLTIPKGASFSINAERDGYILSTLSSSEITRTDNETNKGSVPDTTIENNVSYDFVWVKKAADEESTFTKTWLDDGTNTATHENTPNLVKLQYKVDSDGGEWKDVSESALKVPSGSIAKTSKANGNKSVYTLSYTGLPEYLAGMDENGNYTKQKISYRIDERSVPSGYSKENNGQNLVNTKEYTLQATINWKDFNNAEGVRPAADEIKDLIQVYNGENSDQELVPVDPNNIVVTDNGNGSYTVFVHGLPSYNGSMDSPNTYYIKAFNISDRKASDGQNVQYSTVISNKSGVHENSQDAWNGATITCTISKKMDFSATKKWEDLFPSLRPKAQLGLYRYTSSPQNMELVSVTDTPNEWIKGGNDYPVRFQNLDAYDKNGNQYTYVVKETIPASDNGNYQAIYQDAEGNENAVGCPNGGTILNKNVKNTTSIYVRKHWVAKGTTLKVAGYTVRVGLKRYTNNPENAEIVKDVNGNPVVKNISGFADYNDLTSGTTFSDLPMTDKDGNFYTYVPYEVSESSYIATGAEDGTLDQGDAFTIKDSNGEYDTYQVTNVTSADCSRPMKTTRVAEITNTLGGTIRFVLSKKWAVAPNKSSVQYAIHRVDPYGKEEVLDHDGKTWVALANAKEIYTGELKGAADKRDWGTTDTNIVLPLYDENSSRYTYFVDEVNDKSRHYFHYTLTKDDTGRADLVESVAMTNNNANASGDGQNMDVDLYKTWVDGGDTSTRRPVVIKVFRKDKAGKIDRPAEWDKENIGVYTLSADNGWHVTNLFGFSEKQLTTYFGSEKNGVRTLTDENGNTRTFDNLLQNDIVYREVKVGDTDVLEGENCSYDSYTTRLSAGNGIEVTQKYKVTYTGKNDSEVKNVKQGSVVYEINSKWYDGHYLKGRPDVTFNITRDGNPYATCVVTVDDDGKVSTKVTIDGKDAVEEKDYTFKLGQGESFNDYTLTFDNFPLYNVDAGTRYEYACTESLPSESGYINNSPLDPGFPRTTTGAAGKNKENLKITTSFRNRRVDQSEKISYTKIWKDNSNSENIRPEVTLNLAARVRSASQIQKARGEEDKLDLIPISGDTYMEAVSGKENTYTYTFARSAPKYVTKDLVNASNGALTDDDIGAEVTYYASETMTGEGANNYKETDTPVNGTDIVKVGDKTYLANGSAFTNTLTATMEASGTKVFSNVPYDMESDPLVMPRKDSIIFKLTQNGNPYLVDGQQATAKLEVKGSSFTFAFKDKNDKTLQLPKYDEEGKPYIYSVTESFPDDAATSFGQVFEMTHVSRDLQVTNKYIAQRRSIQVTKTFDTTGWTEDEKKAGRYPDVEFTLYRVKPGDTYTKADSQKLQTKTISGTQFKDGNGTADVTFDNLYDLTPSGQRFAYYVVEKPINGYTTSCSVGGSDTSDTGSDWPQTDTAAMQSKDGKAVYDSVTFKNTYRKDNYITISANKTWGPENILTSLNSTVQNSDLTFRVDGYVNGSRNNVDNVRYKQKTDFKIKWDKTKGDSGFTIYDNYGKPMKFRRYTSQGEPYQYCITEDTSTPIWNVGGALENFKRATGEHYVQNWSYKASPNNSLNLGTIQNVYGRTSLVVTKQWGDNANKNDMRPRSITVKLQYSTDSKQWYDVNANFLRRSTYDVGCDTGRGEITENEPGGVTYTLKEGVQDQNKAWTNCLTFINLPLYEKGEMCYYRVVETAIGEDAMDNNVAASYKYDEDSSTDHYYPDSNVTISTVRNNLLPASVSVQKIWKDEDNKYLARPDSLTLYLQRRIKDGTWQYVKHTSDDSSYTVTITAADKWSHNEPDTLPRQDANGNPYTYRFTEKAEGAVGTEDNVSGVTVKAQHGNISYTGSEKTTSIGDSYKSSTVITNTLDPDSEQNSTSLTVKKNWYSDDGKTPVQFQIQYYDQTTENKWTSFENKIMTLNEGKWEETISNLPKRGKDGSDRFYRAVELDRDGNAINLTDNGTAVASTDGVRDFNLSTGMFRAVYKFSNDNKGITETVTNIKRTTVNVTKKFQDGANREVYRPAKLQISCVSDNKDANAHTRTDNKVATSSEKAISSSTDEYRYSFIVDQYGSDRKKLNYKIAETFIGNNNERDEDNQKQYHQETDGLSKSTETAATVQLKTNTITTAEEADTAAITNKHDISVFDLTLKKTWNDFGNFYKERPQSISVTLQYSTDGTHWNTVKVPISVEDKDYAKAYAADVTAGYSTDAAEKKLTVNKDGSVDAATATWHDLPVYARVDGQRVALQYRVLESKVTDYNNDGTKATSAVTGTDEKGPVKNSTVSLENTLNTTSVTVTKKWVDDNNFNGQRQNIEVQLYQNGTAIKDEVLYQEKARIELKTSGTTAETSAHTFQNLPRQDALGRNYTYTVDEMNVPSGYTKYVSGTTITNRLTPVTASISVTKDFGKNDWKAKAPNGFSFTLQAGNYYKTGETVPSTAVKVPMPGSPTAIATQENPTANFGDIQYTHIGEYHYTLTENNGGVDGVAYDWDDSKDSQRTHSVVVTVSTKRDNTLAASVKYDGQDSLTVKNTFNPVQANIKVTKEFTDWSKTQNGFTFTLKPLNNAPMPADAVNGAVLKTATSEQRTVDFGSINYEKTGTYTYTVQETAGDEDGITYDATPYKVEVVVTKAENASNKLSAVVKYYGKDGKELTEGLTVKNTFTSTSYELKVQKDFKDWTKAGSFTFDLTPVENAPMPADAKDGKKSVTVTNGSAAGFGSITFEKAGTYTYHITEERGTASGVQYDTAEHTAVVTVEKDTKNNNTLSVTGIKYDDKVADALVISNTFTPVQANVAVTKSFNGWTDEAYGDYFANTKFTFNISPVTAGAPLPEENENGENVLTAEASKTVPTAEFKPITFVKEGTYKYNITETNDKKDGISYDGNTHTVTIVVSKDDANNALSVSSIKYDDTNNSAMNDDTHNSLTITNTYTPAVTTEPIQVTKSFSDWSRTEKGFSFTLTAGSNTAGNGEDGKAIATPMPAGANGTSMKADAVSAENATAVFGKITYKKAGTYSYTITEENGGEDGITYDTADDDSTKAKEHQVQVKVEKDPTTNALTAEVTYDGQTSLTITNTVASGTAHIQAKKDFNDWKHSASEFTFTLRAGNYCKPGEKETSDKVAVPMPEGAKDGAISGTATSGAPNVDFGAITYKKAGTYHYTITERNDGKDGVSYDTTEHKVTVTVTKGTDRKNALNADVKYDTKQDSLTIKNTFTAATADIGLTKSFTNPETKENWPVDTSFTFDLKADSNTAGVDRNPMPAVTSVTATKKQPKVDFGEISFTKSGTYYYDVTERNDRADGVSYDTKLHTVAVVVTKDTGTNTLHAKAWYDVEKSKDGTVPKNAATSLTIQNSYSPVSTSIKVSKEFNGWDNWSIFDSDSFKFHLTAVSKNAPMPEKAEASASKDTRTADFGKITYTHPGMYEYKITEENTGLDGVSYDTNAYGVIVYVFKSEDSANKLSAVVKYDGKESLTVTNTFTPVYQILSVSKDFNDWTKAKGFTFDLAAKDNAPMPADGTTVEICRDSEKDENGRPTAAFGKIEFDKAGTYTYTITEQNGSEDGVDYTENSKDQKPEAHEVKVVVEKDPSTNQLSVKSADSLTVKNTYTPVTAHAEVTKDFNDWSKTDSFTFEIAADGNTAKDIDGNPVVNPMPKNKDGREVTEQSVTEKKQTAVFDDMTFEYAGVYNYVITEKNDGRDGVSYDSNEHKVTVTVKKASDATNKLTATVTYEAADKNDTVPENKSSLIIKNTFTPVKIAADGIHKNFNGWTDSEKYGDFFDKASFDFVLKPVTKDAPMPETVKADTSKADASKDNTPVTEAVITATKENPSPAFPEMTFDRAGTYEYTLQEVNGGLDGVDYDTDSTGNPKVHKVVVAVTKTDDETNALSASITYDGQKNLEITNTFTPADPPLHVTKNFNDWSKADSFTFQIKAVTEGAPMPTNLTAKATEKERTASFKNIEFWEVGKGTYEYEITEVNDGIDGIAYDTNAHKAVIKVTKSDDATNRLSSEVLFDGVKVAEYDKTGLMITNTFTPVYQSLSVSKDFNDWTKAKSFTFNLAAKDNAPMPADGTTVEISRDSEKDANGRPTAAFGNIEFDKAGTYMYTITERNGGEDGVDYTENSKDQKPAAHEVKVVVKKDPKTNKLSVKSADSLTVKNTYTPVNAHAEVTKDFNDWSKADSFTFEIAADGNTAKDIDGNPVVNPMPKNKDGREVTEQSVTEKKQTAVFDDMTFEYAGVYNYVITEKNDGRDGVSYDSNEHKVTVTVKKASDATNKLTATVTYEAADKNDTVPENKSSLIIKNTFTPVKIAADGIHKNFNGWTDSEKYGDFFDKASFDFVLKPVTKDAPMPETVKADTSKADASKDNTPVTEAVITATKENPSPAFPEMTFDRAGTYEYTLQEVNGGLDGVDYDTDSTGNPKVHKVVVAVTKTDDETNALSASITYDGQKNLEITNTFTSAKAVLKVTKDFNDWSKASGFKFDLKAEGDSPMPENEAGAVAEATQDHRTAEFGEIQFDKAGTYRYTITEENGGISHITYDSTSHEVEVTVIKDETTNALSVASVKYDGADSLTIKNTYSKPETNETPNNKPTPGDKPKPNDKPDDHSTTNHNSTPNDNSSSDNNSIPNNNSAPNNTATPNNNPTSNTSTTPVIHSVSTSSSKPVQSGDNTPLAGWVLMLITSMSLGLLAFEKKKHNKNNN